MNEKVPLKKKKEKINNKKMDLINDATERETRCTFMHLARSLFEIRRGKSK